MSPAPLPIQAIRAAHSAVYRELRGVKTALVACSGGRDSVALAAVAAAQARRAGTSVGAVIIDHGLQPSSDEVAAATQHTCVALGLAPVVVRKVAVGTDGGPEAAARTARYEALGHVAAETGAELILLGHTLDDQAETVLLSLARGSGTRSLAGMPARRGVFARPFLDVRRATTEAICAEAGLPWWDDPTNAGGPDDPVRSRLRADVMPNLIAVLGEGALASLARTADLARADADLLDQLAEQALTTLSTPPDVTELRALAPALRSRILHQLLLAAGAPSGQLGATHVAAVDALLSKPAGSGPLHLPGDLRVSVECGRLDVVAAQSTDREGRTT